MLPDVSSSTATEFSCGRSVCVTSAGRHSSTRTAATSAVCSMPSTVARTTPSPARRRQIVTPTTTAAAAIERHEQPDGPTAREHELGTFVSGARVFEEELEHRAHHTLGPWAGSCAGQNSRNRRQPAPAHEPSGSSRSLPKGLRSRDWTQRAIRFRCVLRGTLPSPSNGPYRAGHSFDAHALEDWS